MSTQTLTQRWLVIWDEHIPKKGWVAREERFFSESDARWRVSQLRVEEAIDPKLFLETSRGPLDI